MGTATKQLLDFWCPACKRIFAASASSPSPAGGRGGQGGEGAEDTAPCPHCAAECAPCPWYLKNLQKARDNQTGPRTPEGKAKCAANGYSTGSHYISHSPGIPHAPCKPFPQLPKNVRLRDIVISDDGSFALGEGSGEGTVLEDTGGRYTECASCQDIETQRRRVLDALGTSVPVWCHRKDEVNMLFRQAFESGDPAMLKDLAASVNAQAAQTMTALMHDILERGVTIIETTATGVIRRANPSVDRLAIYAEKFGWTMPEWIMTPKAKETKEKAAGNIDDTDAQARVSMAKAAENLTEMMRNMPGAIQRGNDRAAADPVVKSLAEEVEHVEGD